MTITSRRDFLSAFGLTLLSSGMPMPLGAEEYSEKFASAYMDQQNNYGLALLSEKDGILNTYQLRGRGHGMASHKSWLVVFARRAGNFALAIDLNKPTSPIEFNTLANRHFNGHGVFSSDGNYLYATENDYEHGEGIIGIYDPNHGFQRIGEVSTYGIGPHELLMMPKTNQKAADNIICVANGGILTHPETGRTKLNLPTMCSSVVFIDAKNGQLLNKYEVPKRLQRLSLRHMAIDAHHKLWLGGQYEGAKTDNVPLIATASLEHGLDFPNLDAPERLGLAHYIGSVTTSHDGKKIAFTSPKGSRLIIVDAERKIVIENANHNEICGIAPAQNQLAMTSLSGKFNGKPYPLYWDNHLLKLS